MGFSVENGYVPTSVATMMDSVMANYNTQFGTAYVTETFIGTNAYKYFYSLIQLLQENEVKTSEIFLKLQQYFEITNEAISNPVVTNPGLVAIFETNGYVASVKKPIDADAGKIFICVDTDETETDPDYATVTKPAICELIKNSTVAGCVTQGTETEAITLSNGQSFDFKFNLPDRIDVLLKLTITLSENNQVLVGQPDDIKLLLIQNITERYNLGKNFEPERYFSIVDAPWAESVHLEYSLDAGMSYVDDVYDAEYDELFTILLENVTLVEA